MDKPGKGGASAWLPLLVFAALCGLVLLLWRTLDLQGKAAMRAKVQTEADFLSSHIDADLRTRLPALKRMARLWEIHAGFSKEEFEEEALSYIADCPGFQAIEFVDRNSRVRWIAPLAGNEKALGLDLGLERNRREALEKARVDRQPTMSAPIDLVQGGKGFLAYFPIFSKGGYEGCILAVFRIAEWLDYVFSVKNLGLFYQGDSKVSVLYDGSPIYAQPGWDEFERRDGRGGDGAFAASSAGAAIFGHELRVRVIPSEAFIARSRSPLPAIVVASGLVFSALLAFIFHLGRRERAAARLANAAKAELEADIVEREKLEARLQETLVRVDLATKAGGMGVWTWDVATGRLSWNERMFDLFDIPGDVSPTYETWKGAIHPDDVALAEHLLDNAVHGKAKFDTEFRIVLSDGRVRNIRAAARVTRGASGAAEYVTGLNWDVTDTRLAEEALVESEEKVRLLLNSTGEAIYGIDLQGDCTFANPACLRMLGYSDLDELIGKNMHQLIHYAWPGGKPMPVETCRIYRAFRDGRPEHVDDEVLWRSDGSSFPAEYWSYPQIWGGEVRGAVVTFIDISDRRKTEETIRHMATHDALTDLPTMRLYRDRLAMAINMARRNSSFVAVLFVDLDGFKAVNDTFGHDAGDAVLREVAARLNGAVRDTDTVARIGGDEFLLALTELGEPGQASKVAAKAIESISRPMAFGEATISVGASVGISVFPGDGIDVDRLVKRADEAMYKVKKSGKNGWRFAKESA
jgi:diguanylate cyclase (GGDEF)-like protein/PAS domain S-box-containing protein